MDSTTDHSPGGRVTRSLRKRLTSNDSEPSNSRSATPTQINKLPTLAETASSRSVRITRRSSISGTPIASPMKNAKSSNVLAENQEVLTPNRRTTRRRISISMGDEPQATKIVRDLAFSTLAEEEGSPDGRFTVKTTAKPESKQQSKSPELNQSNEIKRVLRSESNSPTNTERVNTKKSIHPSGIPIKPAIQPLSKTRKLDTLPSPSKAMHQSTSAAETGKRRQSISPLLKSIHLNDNNLDAKNTRSQSKSPVTVKQSAGTVTHSTSKSPCQENIETCNELELLSSNRILQKNVEVEQASKIPDISTIQNTDQKNLNSKRMKSLSKSPEQKPNLLDMIEVRATRSKALNPICSLVTESNAEEKQPMKRFATTPKSLKNSDEQKTIDLYSPMTIDLLDDTINLETIKPKRLSSSIINVSDDDIVPDTSGDKNKSIESIVINEENENLPLDDDKENNETFERLFVECEPEEKMDNDEKKNDRKSIGIGKVVDKNLSSKLDETSNAAVNADQNELNISKAVIIENIKLPSLTPNTLQKISDAFPNQADLDCKSKSVNFHRVHLDETSKIVYPRTPYPKSKTYLEMNSSNESFTSKAGQLELSETQQNVENIDQKCNEACVKTPHKPLFSHSLQSSTPILKSDSEMVTPGERNNIADSEPIVEPKDMAESKPKAESKSIAELKPIVESKTIEKPKPIEEPKSIEESKPIEELKPIEESKPIAELNPISELKPISESKSIVEPKSIAETKPAEKIIEPLPFSKSWTQSKRGIFKSGDKIDAIEDQFSPLSRMAVEEARKSFNDVKTADPKNANDIDTELDDELPGHEAAYITSDFVDDEAIEADANYQSGDSMDSAERNEIEENEILCEGESLGSYDTDEENQEFDDESDSFVVSDADEDSHSASTNDDYDHSSQKKLKNYRRIVSSSSEEESQEDLGDNAIFSPHNSNENNDEIAFDNKELLNISITSELSDSAKTLQYVHKLFSENSNDARHSADEEDDESGYEMNASRKNILDNLNKSDRFNKTAHEFDVEQTDNSPESSTTRNESVTKLKSLNDSITKKIRSSQELSNLTDILYFNNDTERISTKSTKLSRSFQNTKYEQEHTIIKKRQSKTIDETPLTGLAKNEADAIEEKSHKKLHKSLQRSYVEYEDIEVPLDYHESDDNVDIQKKTDTESVRTGLSASFDQSNLQRKQCKPKVMHSSFTIGVSVDAVNEKPIVALTKLTSNDIYNEQTENGNAEIMSEEEEVTSNNGDNEQYENCDEEEQEAFESGVGFMEQEEEHNSSDTIDDQHSNTELEHGIIALQHEHEDQNEQSSSSECEILKAKLLSNDEIKNLEKLKHIQKLFNPLQKSHRQSLFSPNVVDNENEILNTAEMSKSRQRRSCCIYGANDFNPSQSFVETLAEQQRQRKKANAKRKRMSKSFCGAPDAHDITQEIDVIRHLHKRSKTCPQSDEDAGDEATPTSKQSDSTKSKKISSIPSVNDNNNNMQRILNRCEEILEAANLAKLAEKVNNKKTKVKLSNRKKLLKQKRIDNETVDIEAAPPLPIKKQIKRLEKKQIAVKQALKASEDLLTRTIGKKLHKCNKDMEKNVDESPQELFETIVKSKPRRKHKSEIVTSPNLSDLENQRKQVNKIKTSTGYFIEDVLTPKKKNNYIEKIKTATGVVIVEPLTPSSNNDFREIPITPRGTGHYKVRRILTAGQDNTQTHMFADKHGEYQSNQQKHSQSEQLTTFKSANRNPKKKTLSSWSVEKTITPLTHIENSANICAYNFKARRNVPQESDGLQRKGRQRSQR